ncbi:NAD(P)H-binding protein [Albimonas pacifica]|uniref:Nucleoside-diphosphate-sugar epimerase n=1 Tax=Albimonas pacifica TaxID=1114924 RepID=A0A1I3CVJ8_9RHOB|nr:NAD(P)H-binding protein [Albimonas pacifica]SFH78378.1 Nucleoside-diphosphate-sugar epimerase [Albimonas pacifica]
MKVFIIGIGGGVGLRLARRLVARGDQVDGLLRRAATRERLAAEGIAAAPGDLVAMSVPELAAAMRGADAIVFTAGAGGRGGPEATAQVDGEGPGKVAAAAELAGIRRFVLVSVFPEAWRERRMNEAFERYMVAKKLAETRLVLTDLDWIVLRPSALSDAPGVGTVDLGLAKVHDEIRRDDVAATIAELLRRPEVGRVILEVTGGATPIADAVAAMTP